MATTATTVTLQVAYGDKWTQEIDIVIDATSVHTSQATFAQHEVTLGGKKNGTFYGLNLFITAQPAVAPTQPPTPLSPPIITIINN